MSNMAEQANLSATIPRDLADADDLLTRYGRWAATSGGGGRGRCGSAEREHRPGDWETVESRRTPSPVQMTSQDALACQRTLARVPDQERVVLAILYVPRRLPPEAQLRLLRIPPRLSRERHLRGLRMFDNLHRLAATLRAT